MMLELTPRRMCLMVAAALVLVGCPSNRQVSEQAHVEPVLTGGQVVAELQSVARGLGGPIWGMTFVDPNTLLYTTRPGEMGLVSLDTGAKRAVSGVPTVFVSGQGGLMDVQRHPSVANLIFVTYAKNTAAGPTTAVGRATLNGASLENFVEIFEAQAHNPNNANNHYGSRLQFDGRGHIFVTVGDRGDRQRAQDLTVHHGKVLRLKEDGTAPEDNPFYAQGGAARFIWSYGHRNAQGLVYDPATGNLWEMEHGPRGGDEINLVQKGLNYGWPIISYGKEYRSGAQVGVGTEQEGMEQPVKYYIPSIAPCGLMLYTGEAFPDWKGSLFSGALALQHLNRVKVQDGVAVAEERLLGHLDSRFRSVIQGPDDFIYFGTDEGYIGRLAPAPMTRE